MYQCIVTLCYMLLFFPEDNIDETYGVNVQIEESDEDVSLNNFLISTQ